MRRVRIVTNRPDGTRASDAPGPSEGNWPYTRGRDLRVTIVNDDGSESSMPGVKSVDVLCAGRTEPVLAVITVYGAELDITTDAEYVNVGAICTPCSKKPGVPRHSYECSRCE